MGFIHFIERYLPTPKFRDGGLVTWVMGGVRRRLVVAVVLFVAAPALMGFFLWRASNAKKTYTTKVPVVIYNYSSNSLPLDQIMESLLAEAAVDRLAEPLEVLRRHHWERAGINRGVRHHYDSVVSLQDFELATRAHEELIARFAEVGNDRYPGLRIAAGADIAAAKMLAVDDYAIKLNTRLSLISSITAYALGLTVLSMALVKVRWDFG